MDHLRDSSKNFFRSYFDLLNKSILSLPEQLLVKAGSIISETGANGGKVIFAGNGGSAAMASHLSVDLTKGLGIRAINFNESDLITCFANDYGYEKWVSKAIEFYADPVDTVVLISSSGQSPNIKNAAMTAKELKIPVITFSGFRSDNDLRKIGDLNFWCDSSQYNIVEMTHHTWLLSIVDYLIYQKSGE
jgi:D-sedoheptulose 7-phosphate isomerase